MDLHKPVTIRNRPEIGVEDELSHRYFMLSAESPLLTIAALID